MIDCACTGIHIPHCCFQDPLFACCIAAMGGDAASDSLMRQISDDEDRCYHLHYASLDKAKVIE